MGGGSSDGYNWGDSGRLFGTVKEPPKPECLTFHPYTGNPSLCKACNGPVTEHKTFLQAFYDKKRKEEDAAAEQLRESVLSAAGREIDPDEMVYITKDFSLKRSQLEALRTIALEGSYDTKRTSTG
jgi:hypothetical protein